MYDLADSLPAAPCPSTSPLRVPRGQAVVLRSRDPGDRLIIRFGSEATVVSQALPRSRFLLLIAGDQPLSIEGPTVTASPVPEFLPRLLAFLDHARSTERRQVARRDAPALLPLTDDLQDLERTQHWLMEQVLRADPDFSRMALYWAHTETYLLVRFVLANPTLNVQQLAARYGLSATQFRRVTRRAFGRPLKEQLRLLRANRALHYYVDTRASFTQVSGEFGFSSPSHFCSEIKALLGRPPVSIFQPIKTS